MREGWVRRLRDKPTLLRVCSVCVCLYLALFSVGVLGIACVCGCFYANGRREDT